MLKEIPGYENYLINESGIIIDQDGNLIRESVNNEGYMYAYLNNKNVYIHDLVASTFLTNKDNFKYVIHKNNDPLNNHITNIAWSENPEETDKIELFCRENRDYSSSKNIYEVFNDETGDIIECQGRGAVAELIQYEEISLKNMVGNGRKIFLGPYKGYQIRRIICNF